MTDRGPNGERFVSGEQFAEALRRYLPRVAVDRLGSIEDQRRGAAEGPEAGGRGSVEDVLAELGVDYTPFRAWGDAFLTAINRAGVEPFPDLFARIPTPPDEPGALWERLLELAERPGASGVSACLLLHTLACARAVRALK